MQNHNTEITPILCHNFNIIPQLEHNLKGACDENVNYIDFLCARGHFCRRLRLFRWYFNKKNAICVLFCYSHNHSSVEFAR